MAYTSSFKTLKGDTISLTISGGSGELTLDGQEPVVIEYTQDNIFSPLKLSTCSVSIITDSPMLDLYSGAFNVKIEVYRNGSPLWFGFLSPNVYSMPLDSKNNKLTLEFVDPLTAMQDVKFSNPGTSFFNSFYAYIEGALKAVGAVDSSGNVSISGLSDTGLGCMYRNFIDETADADDGAMTWQEVMESIMRYLNKTAYCWGGTLYVYDTMASRSAKSMTELGIAGSDGQISLGDVYNKVTVVANSNPMDTYIPELFDDDANNLVKRFEGDTNDEYFTSIWAHAYYYYALYQQSTYLQCPSNLYYYKMVLYTGAYTRYPIYNYAHLTNEYVDPDAYNGTIAADSFPVHGCFLQRAASSDWNKASLNDWAWSVTMAAGDKIIYPERDVDKSDLYVETTPVLKDYMFGGGYLILALSWRYTADARSNISADSVTWEGTGINSDSIYAVLKIGNLYWNGSKWDTSSSTFAVFNDYIDTKANVFDTDRKVNSQQWDHPLSDDTEGLVIPLPENITTGDVYFKLFAPNNLGAKFEKDDKTYVIGACQITDLQLIYATEKAEWNVFSLNDTGDSDITYTGNLDEDNIQEADDVEFTTNTYSVKQASYSYAIQKSGDTYSFYVPTTLPEQACIDRMVNYYGTPKMTYQITLNETSAKSIAPTENISASFLNKEFTVGAVTYNLADSSAEVTLFEI